MCSHRAQSSPIPACVVLLLFAGCRVGNGADRGPDSRSPGTNNVSSTTSDAACRDSENSVPKAYFAFGENCFEPDKSICFGRTKATATASDLQKRRDRPALIVNIYDPAVYGGLGINTFSAVFDRGDHEEHWVLSEGMVEKHGRTVTASGTLKGTLLLPQPDGTRKSAPLGPADVLPFEARIECQI